MTGAGAWRAHVRTELVGLAPYGAPQLDVPVALNVNENPYGPPPEVAADIAAAVAECASSLNRYPDRDARELRAALAEYLTSSTPAIALDADHVWAANGSNEVMLQLLQAFGGPERRVLTFPPTYSMYPEYARATHTGLVEIPRASDFSLDPVEAAEAVRSESPDVVILTSPNNPTGTAAPVELMHELARAAAPGLLVVDEAYAEFARPGAARALHVAADHPNVVVVRTMSKAFALAGARVGYLVADPQVVAALQLVRLPYHLSTVTQATALAALRHSDALLSAVALLRDERDLQVAWLRERGAEVADSDANFVLVGRFADRDAVWRGLLERGVLVRQTGPDGWLRVSIGTPVENEAFRVAYSEVVG